MERSGACLCVRGRSFAIKGAFATEIKQGKFICVVCLIGVRKPSKSRCLCILGKGLAISTAISFIHFSISGSAFLVLRSVYVGATLGNVRGAKAGGASGLR